MKFSIYLSPFFATLLLSVFTVNSSFANSSDYVSGHGPKTNMSGASAKPRYSFAQIGQFKLSDSTLHIGDGDESFEGELDDLPFFTGGIQQITGGNWIRFGWEAGAMMSWQNDTVSVYSNGGSTHVRVKNNFFMFGTFAGLLIDLPIASFARLFVSAGPSLSFASLRLESDNDPVNLPQNVYMVNEYEQAFGLGGYASAGLLISPEKNYEIGLVIRESHLGLDLSNHEFGTVYEGQQILLSFGARL
ncbi:MAG: hypothetical protein HRU20_15605 [Pseudomonadales bacterium]|nr:hypothetical protein [Pseudomonadales bacterium]